MSMGFRYSRHAQEEMRRRGISQKIADHVLHNPEQIVLERAPRKAYQSCVDFGSGKILLVRLIVDDSVKPSADNDFEKSLEMRLQNSERRWPYSLFESRILWFFL